MLRRINVPDMQVGDIYEVIVNWKDMNNFYFCQMEVTDENPSWRDVANGILSLRSMSAEAFQPCC